MNNSIMVWVAIASNLLIGCLLLHSGDALGATPIHMAGEVLGGRWGVCIASFVAATCSLMAMRGKTTSTTILWFIPQQALLYLGAFGSALAIWTGAYADGEPRPHEFIAAGEHAYLLIALAHNWAILRLYLMRKA